MIYNHETVLRWRWPCKKCVRKNHDVPGKTPRAVERSGVTEGQLTSSFCKYATETIGEHLCVMTRTYVDEKRANQICRILNCKERQAKEAE